MSERASFFVPGRVEVLGKHTDYAGGRSLLCAVSRGFSISVARSTGPDLRITNSDTGEVVAFPVHRETPDVPGAWHNYPRVVARRLAHNFGAEAGGEIAFTSNLPIAAGISSSSALVVGSFLALNWLNDIDSHPAYSAAINGVTELADYLGCVENGRDYPGLPGTLGVGTTGGSEDHTAILCGTEGMLRQYAFAPTRFEDEAAMPPGYVFAIASSGVSAEKTGAALRDYNMLGTLGNAAVRAWNRYTGAAARHLGEVLQHAPLTDLLAAINAYAPEDVSTEWVMERTRQFYEETFEIIPAAVTALKAGDLATFGALVVRSQQAAEDGLRNQVPETIELVSSALDQGAIAASAFGAGFGGSVWAMLEESAARQFLADWSRSYATAFPARDGESQFFLERPGGPATRQKTEAVNN